ncbi:Protein CLEC16A [Amphibalanus amphitrite]|uniref:Protein CLEC16A n=1 Tax=Amphibalanus amphitrite TaxID=1232801 RepID=A0A6A4WZC0_AMPAM|nr:Protein CLEC16A [Amphibalanus amphitrite]KAF0312326.1 Protein CLEC16A [Amphibalanus amphitrite]
MFKGRLFGGVWKPKNPHSLEHLKHLYNVLQRNQTVSEGNRGLLVETLRSIAEILIWGDQNDSTVFDFFLEKNMLSFFLKIMKQKCGSYVCVQLLQTLNILFENIRNETSIYYLLSNNHVNSIIVHKFDFSDEEVMAYYISFLKTLSLKLNTHTVHFFYNEHTNDFPLYTEAIKFFNHSETMVRIAVRTLTLNVYRVEEKSMLQFIRDMTAVPYFSNLVWFIGNHVLELDRCVRSDSSHQCRGKLADLVAEHLDHIHYLNDILCLNIEELNQVLTEHLLSRLLLPLYVFPLAPEEGSPVATPEQQPRVSTVVSLFLLSQVFLIFTHQPLVRLLARIILTADQHLLWQSQTTGAFCPGFVAPVQSLEQSLEEPQTAPKSATGSDSEQESPPATAAALAAALANLARPPAVYGLPDLVDSCNYTDEEKRLLCRGSTANTTGGPPTEAATPSAAAAVSSPKPFMASILDALDCSENDYTALFALCLLHAIGHNKGINSELLDTVLLPCGEQARQRYNSQLAERVIGIIAASCLPNSCVRLVTLELSLVVLQQLVMTSGGSVLSDADLARVEEAREQATLTLRNFYKSEEIFLDIFEDEYREMKKRPINVEYLMMDDRLLLPPAGTPMSGVEFSRRLPCGEVERARCAIRVFLLLRDTSLTLRNEPDTQLPLQRPDQYVGVDETLDLNNSDLIACTVTGRDGGRKRRFLVIDVLQLLLVDPDPRRLGWGLAKFAGALQDVEVTGDKEDSRVLHVTVHGPAAGAAAAPPLLSAKFVFDDHIRCMAAKQKLVRGRQKARQRKMYAIGRLLELPGHLHPCPVSPHQWVDSDQEQTRRVSSRPGGAGAGVPTSSSPLTAAGRAEEGSPAAAGAAAGGDEIASGEYR